MSCQHGLRISWTLGHLQDSFLVLPMVLSDLLPPLSASHHHSSLVFPSPCHHVHYVSAPLTYTFLATNLFARCLASLASWPLHSFFVTLSFSSSHHLPLLQLLPHLSLNTVSFTMVEVQTVSIRRTVFVLIFAYLCMYQLSCVYAKTNRTFQFSC